MCALDIKMSEIESLNHINCQKKKKKLTSLVLKRIELWIYSASILNVKTWTPVSAGALIFIRARVPFVINLISFLENNFKGVLGLSKSPFSVFIPAV